MKRVALAMVLMCAALLVGCGNKDEKASKPPEGGAAPRVEIEFWHSQSDANGELLKKIVADFNAASKTTHVTAVYIGTYDQIFRKVTTSMTAGKVPDLAGAYESMVAEYMAAGVVEPLDSYLADPEIGYSARELEDFYPAFVETNRFPQFGNQLLSFPFTKSVLMMYYSVAMLKDAGFERPPETWDDFVEQCRAVKEKTGRAAYALSVDASTIHAMILSFGGDLVRPDGTTGYGSPATVKSLDVIQKLIADGLASPIKTQSYDDRADVAGGRCAFMIRSSTTRPYLDELIKDKFAWDMSIIPHGEGQKPVTVLFGANICMFKHTRDRQRAAWEFIKYFCSPEVTALWATKTGYLPVRRSAAGTAVMEAFFGAKPQNRRAVDVLPFARPEPNVAGSQAVRTAIEKAEMEVVSKVKTAEEAAKELGESAEKILKESRSGGK